MKNEYADRMEELFWQRRHNLDNLDYDHIEDAKETIASNDAEAWTFMNDFVVDAQQEVFIELTRQSLNNPDECEIGRRFVQAVKDALPDYASLNRRD